MISKLDLHNVDFPPLVPSIQILEYMGGGDLLNLLIERDVFEENFTRFYVAEVGYSYFSCGKASHGNRG